MIEAVLSFLVGMAIASFSYKQGVKDTERRWSNAVNLADDRKRSAR